MTEKIDRRAEREARKQQRQLINAGRGMRSKMIKFCQDERFAPLLATGLPTYWNSFYDATNADEMDMNESLRFFDWLFYDYQPDPEQPRLVELFAEEMKTELNERELQVLENWVDTPAPSAYEYLDFDAINARFKLKDYFTGEEVIAFAPAGAGQSKKGDLIFGPYFCRLVMILSLVQSGLFIPSDEVDGFKGKNLTRLGNADPEGPANQFMRRNNHLIVHHALEKSIDEGRFAVSRLDPTRVDKAVKRRVKKIASKIKRKKKEIISSLYVNQSWNWLPCN